VFPRLWSFLHPRLAAQPSFIYHQVAKALTSDSINVSRWGITVCQFCFDGDATGFYQFEVNSFVVGNNVKVVTVVQLYSIPEEWVDYLKEPVGLLASK